MLSITKKYGKLNILFKRLEFDDLIDSAFFLMLAAMFCINSTANYLYYAGFFLFVGLSMLKVLMRLRYDGAVNIPAVCWWFLAFTLFSLLSVLWSDYPDATIAVMTRLVQILAVMFSMAQNYATRKGFFRCMKIMCRAGIFCALYIYAATPVSEWFSGRLGGKAVGANVNSIGMVFTVCILFTLYYAYYQRKKTYYAFVFIEFMLIVLTGSRKSILTVLFAFFVLVVIKELNYKMIFRLVAAGAIVLLIIYLMFTNETLYHVAGQRFETMIEHLTTNSGDYSMYARDLFIDYAKQFFYEKPIIGSGIATFIRKLGAEIGMYAYAHNNYYELLMGGGIIGFGIYYSFYAYIIVKLLKMSFIFGDDTAKIMLMVMLSIMICEYGIVLYYSVYTLAFITLAFLYVCLFDNERGKKRIFMSDSSRQLLGLPLQKI